MTPLKRRLIQLEARVASTQPRPSDLDGIDVKAISDLALDVLEMVVRCWPTDLIPSGLAAALVAACERSQAEQLMGISMALGKFWPEGEPSGDLLMELAERVRTRPRTGDCWYVKPPP
jgi:hypothetical protein